MKLSNKTHRIINFNKKNRVFMKVLVKLISLFREESFNRKVIW